MEDWCGVLGRLCGSQGEFITCYLCLDEVYNSSWTSGEHRKQCASRNTSQLTSYPTHPTLNCSKCRAKLKLWPEQGPSFSCDSGFPSCPGKGKLLSSTGENRYNCFQCDFDLCKECTSVWEEKKAQPSAADPTEKQNGQKQNGPKQNGSCQPENGGAPSKQDENQNNRTSLLIADDDNIPLIDVQSSSEDIPDLVNISTRRPVSASVHKKPEVLDARSRSVASLGVGLPELSNNLTSQVAAVAGAKLMADSPDIFNLRAPLVSCENFLTPATSKEGLNQSTGASSLVQE